MPRHQTALMILVLGLSGCVHGRNGPPVARGSAAPPVAMRPIPSLRETINGDLRPGANAAGGPTMADGIPTNVSPSRLPAPRPVAIASLPSIRDTINEGPKPPADPGPAVTAMHRAAIGSAAANPPTTLPPLPPEVAASSSSPGPVPAEPPAALPQLPPEVAVSAAAPELPPLPNEAPALPNAATPAQQVEPPAPAPITLVDPPPTLPESAQTVNANDAPPMVDASVVPTATPAPITIVDPPPAGFEPPQAAASNDAPVDSAVRPVVSDPTEFRSRTEIRSQLDTGKVISHTVATVGSESVSLSELQDAVREFVRANVPKGQKISREDANLISKNVLEGLIDQAILAQEAKHVLLKSDKQRQAFDQFLENVWKDRELPKLMRRHDVKSERALREKLEEQGRSLDLVRERFRRDTMAQEFMMQAMRSRLVAPEGPELWSYYQAHLKDFQRPARITWREIAVKVDRSNDRAAAKRKAEVILDRLRRGEDFTAIATKESQGPTASKGGLWETEPGAVAAPAVNAALATLPLNTVSTVLEAPASYHLVRVEGRREAGPTPFYEVQNEIRTTLQNEAAQREAAAYTAKLREKTIVTYHFGKDRAETSAPRDAQTRPAAVAP